MALRDLSDDELVRDLHSLCGEGNRLVARIIVYLIEVEERRLDLRAACSSMFDFCRRRLGLSEGAAFRRITAARLVKRFPRLLARIESGEIHLSSLMLLRDHLTDANLDALVSEAAGKTKREVEELVARRAPRPDVPSTIRMLPQRPPPPSVAPAPAAAPSTPPRPQARIEPLAAERHKVQLTVSSEVRAKLERARDLMRHRNPSGDLAVVVEQALDGLLAKLEKERLGKTTRLRRKDRTEETMSIPRDVREEVFARDGEQCTFFSTAGERCPARDFLELDHIEPRALGGSHDATNLRVRCRSHDLLYAEEKFGKARVHFRQNKYAPPSPPTLDDETRTLGTRALVGMGFREPDVRRALDTISARHAGNAPPPINEILRDAIGILT